MHVLSVGRNGKYDSASYVENALGNEPQKCCNVNTTHQRFDGYKYRQPHKNVADGLDIAMILEVEETHVGTYDSRCPYKG